MLTTMIHAAHALGRVINEASVALEEWSRNNPETMGKLALTWELLTAEEQATQWRDQYDENGDAIPFERAVRLAFFLMAFRLPYDGERGKDGGDMTQVYDFEMRAVYAQQDGRLLELLEGAQTSPLDFRAAQAALSDLMEGHEPIPNEFIEWGLQVATEKVQAPPTGTGRNPYKNVVRDERIAKTVQTLVACGLTATRNEISEPESACDAVSKALEANGVPLSYYAVAKIWQRYRKDQKGK